MSKGGALHHFRTKDALLRAVVQELVDRFERALEARVAIAASERRLAPWLRCYIEEALKPSGAGDRALAAVLFGLPPGHAALRPLADAMVRWRARALTPDIDPAVATAARLAADGLWLERATGAAGEAELMAAGAVILRLLDRDAA